MKDAKAQMALVLILLLVNLPIAFGLEISPGSIIVSPSHNSAEINWTTNQLADGKVKYGKSIESVQTIPETGGDKIKHSVQIPNLEEATRYFYKIESSDGESLATMATWADFTTTLPKVTGLKAVEVSATQIDLEWSAHPAAVEYDVYLNSSLLASVTDKNLSVSATELTDYEFMVRAKDADGVASDPSDFVVVTTPKQPTQISFVQALEVTKNSAKVSWKTDLNANGSVAYGVAQGKLDQLKVNTEPPIMRKNHQITLSGLENGKTYYYVAHSNDAKSDVFSFTTLVNDSVSQLSSIEVQEITQSTAVVKWRSSSEGKGSVQYGIGDAFNLETPEDVSAVASTVHEVQLSALVAGQEYFFRIVQDGVVSEAQSFTTLAKLGDFLNVDTPPSLIAGLRVNITGNTKPGTRLFIYTNDATVPQVKTVINGTAFREEVLLNPLVNFNGDAGKNKLRIVGFDAQGKKDEIILYVTVDNAPPLLDLNPIPEYTSDSELMVSGLTEPGVLVRALVGSVVKTKVEANESGAFSMGVPLGNDNNTLTIQAIDAAGNVAASQHLVVKDVRKPVIKFHTEFKQNTHFKILTVRGETEPNAQVYVTNFGEYSGCEDAEFTKNIMECQKQVGTTHHIPDTLLSENIDLLGAIVGSSVSTRADDGGNFTIRIPMFMGERTTQGKNQIQFLAVDRAGNVGETTKTVFYRPGCADWRVAYSEVRAYPFNIYSREITDGSVTGSVFIPIEYLGSGVPDVRVRTLAKDDNSIHDPFIPNLLAAPRDDLPDYVPGSGPIENGNSMVTINRMKSSKYDPQTNRVYVYAPVTINRWTKSVKDLPGQLNLYLEARLEYTVDGNTMPFCQVYPQVSYSVERPIDYELFLTPEMINSTLAFLDKTISVTEDIIDGVKKLSMYTLLGCGGMIAWSYLQAGFSGAAEAASGSQCTEAEESMEEVYWVCDRIMCPNVPPKCEGFDHESYKVNGQVASYDQVTQAAAVNQQYYDAYYQRPKNADYNLPMSEWLRKNAHSIGSSYQPVAAPTLFQTEVSEDKRYTVEYFRLENRKLAKGEGQFSLTTDSGNRLVLGSELDTIARRKCGPNHRTLVKYTSENREADTFLKGQTFWVDKDVTYTCSDKLPEQLGVPQSENFVGCYSDQCPAFDNTKCLADLDGVNPAEGLWSSTACGCLPGIKGHLENYVRIMKGAQQCLRQAQIGEVRGGYCQRLLAQFICDLFSELIMKSLFGGSDGSSGLLGGVFGRDEVQNYKSNTGQITNSLSNRYKDIVDNRLGLSADQLQNKVCLFALTLDWEYLESFLNQVVETVNVDPIIHVESESRPYGFDPFTGRMNINYYTYVGVTPGGPMEISLQYDCNRNGPNGEFCPNIPPSQPKYVQGFQRRSLRKTDSVNTNINEVDQNAVYWYNEILMIAKYKLGGQDKTIERRIAINRKGDLAFGCNWNTASGITCRGPEFLEDQIGGIEVHGQSTNLQTAGTRLTPANVPTYYANNKVSGLVKLSNRFNKDFFYVRVIDGAREVEYEIPVANTPVSNITSETQANYAGEKVYNLWFDTVRDVTSSTKYGLVSMKNHPIIDGDFKIVAPSELNGVTLRLMMQSKSGSTVSDDCRIEGSSVGSPVTCIKSDGSYGFEASSSQKVTGKDIAAIKEVRVLSLQPKDAKDKQFQFGFSSGAENGTFIVEKDLTQSKSAKTIKVEFLQDSNDNGGGDTPIWYDGKPQTLTFKYQTGAEASGKEVPIVDFIEPLGDYFNNNDFSGTQVRVPVGFSIWDDNEDIKSIKLKIQGKGAASSYSCEATFELENNWFKGYLPDESGISTNNCGFVPHRARSTFHLPNAPMFYGFWWYPTSDVVRNSLDHKYMITLFANDGAGTTGTSMVREFWFDQNKGASALKEDDIMVCLGGGDCAFWSEGETPQEKLVTTQPEQQVFDEKVN